jgi:lipoprotein NlpI
MADDMSASDYAKRAYEKGKSGDLAGALSDYDKSIELRPDNANAYWSRGTFYFEQARWDMAVADFRKSDEFKSSWRGQVHLFIWVARARMGEREAADKELELKFAAESAGATEKWSTPMPLTPADTFDKAASTLETGNALRVRPSALHRKELPEAPNERQTGGISVGPDDWTLTVVRFLTGRMKEADFFSVPPAFDKDTGQRPKYWPAGRRSCEALFYAGVKRLLDGNKKKAADYFKECATMNGPNELVEQRFARAELQRIASQQ